LVSPTKSFLLAWSFFFCYIIQVFFLPLSCHEWHCHIIVSIIVATLALGSQPRQGLAMVRAKNELGSNISCSRECKRMWRNEPSHSQVNSHFGSWSLNELPNFQRAISGVKTHWIETFLISLKSSWNVDVSNELAWPIWTPETQVMAKRRVSNQIGNLIPNH